MVIHGLVFHSNALIKLLSISNSSFRVQAVQQLYYDPDPGVKDSAQRWLLLAQRSPQAWHFAWALLAADKVRVLYTKSLCSTFIVIV